MVRLNDGIVAEIMRAQNEGDPLKVYRKAIIGKIIARVIDPFSGERAEVLVEGHPKNTPVADLEISLWTPLEVTYFEKFNRGIIENGSLIVVGGRSDDIVNFSNALSDEDLERICTEPFFSMRKDIKKITSETTMQRLLTLAKEVNRPARTLQEIELRLEEIQQSK